MLLRFSKLHIITIGLFASLFSGAIATAGIIYDSGVVTFSPTGTQFGRIARDGTSSIWGVVKTFPSVVGTPTAHAFEVIDIADTGDPTFIQISLDDPDAALFMAAYLNSFDPVNTGPNFGLDVNYLGDPGSSQPEGLPSFFQIEVAPHSHLIIPISELAPGGGAGRSFELLVEGFFDSSFAEASAVPEPNSLFLCGAGVLALCLRRIITQLRRSGGNH